MKTSSKIKLFIILGVEFIAVVVMLLLIFLSGKQTYTVQFDLNGGTLLSGDLVQTVRQGNDATPPKTTKDGCYFLKWSTSYSKVTKDLVIEAVWEYETSPGIEYNIPTNANYCTISGGFEGLQGEVYIGAYNGSLKVLGIEEGAFKNCTGITKIHLLDGIVTIGAGAFEGCTALTSIELPETVALLGENAFKDCISLTEVTLPKDLKGVSANTFKNCSALEKVVFPEPLEVIKTDEVKDMDSEQDEKKTGNKSASDATTEGEVEYVYTLTSIGANAFEDCTALTSLEIPDGVTTIGAGAFKNCTALTEVTLPKELTGISVNLFYGCTALEAIVFPEGVTSIGTGAFRGCAALTEVEIPAGVLSIGTSAFRECTALKKVVLNEGLETIHNYAFQGCTELSEMTLPSTIIGVGMKAFENTLLTLEGYPELEINIPNLDITIKPIDPDILDSKLDGLKKEAA